MHLPTLAFLLFLAFVPSLFAADAPAIPDDPYLIYEELDNPDVLDWVRRENARTLRRLEGDPRYDEYYGYILERLTSDDRLVLPSIYRDTDTVYNFWRDADNPQGIIRQSTLEKFFAGNADWQTVIDFDALSRAEGKTWVYGGTSRLYSNSRHALIGFSDGGKDAVMYREFDYRTGEFVPDGFVIPESKNEVDWLDRDTLLVGIAAEGERTESGYPRVVKRWKRGTPLAEAEPVFSCLETDLVAVGFSLLLDDGLPAFFFARVIDSMNSEMFRYSPDDGRIEKLRIPTDASLKGIHKGLAFVWLKSDWEVGGTLYRPDSVVSFPYEQLFSDDKDITLFYEPSANAAFHGITFSRDYAYQEVLRDVKPEITQFRYDGGTWTSRLLPINPLETASLLAVPFNKGFVLFEQGGFTDPTRLYKLDEDSLAVTEIQAFPTMFNPDEYVVRQNFADSADGVRVPYFVVHRKDLELNGDNPVIIEGYGGFRVAMLPDYIPVHERCWLRDGGVYVLANIRGGGEFGPEWHRQVLKENRPKAFADFIAVAEDLIARGYTRPGRIGVEGASNGGLLTGSVLTRRPDLYGAAVIEVPLLDMLRYHKLPPGASWIGEYGDPEIPAEREALAAYSPYQNVKKGMDYPPPFILTSTKDDRVHPGHARKFAKRLEEYGYDFYYYEELDGGHSANANARLTAKNAALKLVYLHKQLQVE